MKGSSRNSGPPPDPGALRRNRDAGDWVLLPAVGRQKPPPVWPLVAPEKPWLDPKRDPDGTLAESIRMELAAREADLWELMWAKPQAVMWEQMGLEHEVALFVRALAEAERSHSAVNLRTLVKQHQENLGLSVAGLARNRWRIAAIEVDDDEMERDEPRSSVRDRFKVVPPEAGEAS